MGRTAKIAMAGTLGGLLIALSAGIALREERESEPLLVHQAGDGAKVRTGADLRRCRTQTAPDAGCEAAWEQKRRRFFARDDRR